MRLWKHFAVVALTAAVACAPGAYAATLTVTSDAGDTSAGSLRGLVNAAADGDVIVFDPSVTSVELGGIVDGRKSGWTIDGDLGGGDRVTIKNPGNYAVLMMRGNTLKNIRIDNEGTSKNYSLLFYVDANQNGKRVGEATVVENVWANTNSAFTGDQIVWFGGINDGDPDNQFSEVQFLNCQFEGEGYIEDEEGNIIQSGEKALNLAGRFHGIGNLIIDGCTFTNFDGHAMWLGHVRSGVNNGIPQATIQNNVIVGPGTSDQTGTTRGITLYRLNQNADDELLAADWVIQDNEFYKVNYGIDTFDVGSYGVRIEGNTFGLDPEGAPEVAYEDWCDVGIYLRGNARDVQIGGADTADQNIIANCRQAGILYGATIDLNPEDVQVLGNSIYNIDSQDSEGNWDGDGRPLWKSFYWTDAGAWVLKEYLDGEGGLPYLGNAMAPKPVVTNVDAAGVSGSGVNPGATVRLWTSGPRAAEVKAFAGPAGLEMETYVAETVADGSGNWSFSEDFSGMMDHWVSLVAVNDNTGDYPYQTSQLTALPITGEDGDRDMDGLMDWWEEMYGLSTMDAATFNGPNYDADLDQYETGDEYELLLSEGLLSDPTDPNSNPGAPENLQGLPAVSMLAAALGLGAIAMAAVRRPKRRA